MMKKFFQFLAKLFGGKKEVVAPVTETKPEPTPVAHPEQPKAE